jgi:hypothetical protein
VEHIEYFDESVADGSKTHTSEEVIDHILGKKRRLIWFREVECLLSTISNCILKAVLKVLLNIKIATIIKSSLLVCFKIVVHFKSSTCVFCLSEKLLSETKVATAYHWFWTKSQSFNIVYKYSKLSIFRISFLGCCERLMQSNILNVSRFREITQIDFIVQACFPTE